MNPKSFENPSSKPKPNQPNKKTQNNFLIIFPKQEKIGSFWKGLK